VRKHEIREKFRELAVWRRGDERAPHKPLLLLLAFGEYRRGANRLLPFADLDPVLRKLLEEFGPPRKSHHPEYPFWHLQSDGVWQLETAGPPMIRETRSNPPKSELIKLKAAGGLTEGLHNALIADPALLSEIARDLLEEHFPATLHDDILEAVGLDLELAGPGRAKRDPRFRDDVIMSYEYRCAVCGFDMRLGDALVALEAAHIRWHQAGGPSTVDNGLALCSMHHKLFDRGAFTVSTRHQVEVSQLVNGSTGVEEWLLSFHGGPVRVPDRPDRVPNLRYLKWHRGEVFRQPARHLEN
jgi:putative restriction endonuclease